jgi:rubrerythrin
MMQPDRQAALLEAIKIELKGKAFYVQARDQARHQLGKQIFAHLVKEEDGHLKRIRDVFQALQEKRPWPETKGVAAPIEAPGKVFARLVQEQAKHLKGDSDDIQALETALVLEEKNEKFYRDLIPKSQDAFEQEFFERLAGEERGHYQLVGDTIQYLSDPETWFQEKQRSHFDGA